MAFKKGDRVCNSPGGTEMEVVACSGLLALCRWERDGRHEQALFELSSLSSPGVRQQRQFQQQQQPNFQAAPANDGASASGNGSKEGPQA